MQDILKNDGLNSYQKKNPEKKVCILLKNSFAEQSRRKSVYSYKIIINSLTLIKFDV